MVHDFFIPDSLRDSKATVVARTLAVEALQRALHP